MNRRKTSNHKGITLIALVISIIVMLILAGVSLNATIGDNGIITKAQDAKIQNGMAVLEEYLQQKYVEYYDELNNYNSKPELLNAKMPNLFLKDGNRNYISYDGKAYYLINKNSLPNEIKNGLVGGDTSDYSSYIRLYDVYGITTDLKVYYCDNENNVLIGDTDAKDIDPNTPLTSLNNNSTLKDAVEFALKDIGITTDENLGITTGDITNLKELTLDGNKNLITTLSGISEINNLKKLTLKNLKLNSLKGIESMNFLSYLYLENCEIEEYNAISNCYSLSQLFLNIGTYMDETTANCQVNKLGEALSIASNIKSLKKLGVFGVDRLSYNWGWLSYDLYLGTDNTNTQSNLTSINGLANIASNIKSSLEYLYLNNNNIKGSLESLDGYDNLIGLAVYGNKNLELLNGITSIKIEYIHAQYCALKNISNLTSITTLKCLTVFNNSKLESLNGIEKCNSLKTILAYSCSINDISALNSLVNINRIDLRNNINLINLNGIEALNTLVVDGNTVALKYLYLEGCSTSMTTNKIKEIILQCGTNYSLPTGVKCLTGAIYNWTDYYSNTTEDIYSKIYSDLYENKYVKNLSLNNCIALTNENFQTILSTTTNVEKLYLYGCTTLTNDGFTSNMSKLQQIDLRSCTNLVNLSSLNEQAKLTNCKLNSIFLSNKNIELDDYQDLLNTVSKNYVYSGGIFGLCITNSELAMKLESCTELTMLCCYGNYMVNNIDIDLSNTKLTTINCKFNWKVKCPSTLIVWKGENSGIPDFALCKDLSTFDIAYSSFLNSDFQSIINSLANIQSLFTFSICYSNIVGNNGIDLSLLSSSNCTRISIGSNVNVKKIKITNKYINNFGVEIIGTFPKLSTVSFNNLMDLLEIKIDGLKNITNLYLDSCNTLDNNNISIANLNNLNSLSITGTKITNFNCIDDDSMKNLQYITANNNKISDISKLSICSKLLQINLTNNYVENLSILENIINIDTNKVNLQKLILTNNSVGKYSSSNHNNIDTLVKLYNAGLRILDLTNNNFYDGQANEIVNLYGSGLTITYGKN